MSNTVRIPEDLHEELKARRRPDETMAETIARHLDRPHPAETRAMLTGEEAAAVADAVEDLYDGESDRLDRARTVFESTDTPEGDEAGSTTPPTFWT